jgi:hypothetical protein
MSRGKSTRLMASLPASYSDDFEKKLDKRTRVARAYMAKVAAILSDQGGAEGLGHFELVAIKKAAFDEVIMEAGMIGFFKTGTVDYGVNSQAAFSWIGTVQKMLGGPKRKARPVNGPQTYIEAARDKAAA